MEKPERRYPLNRIPWPQSCCPDCARLGTGIEPFRCCRCAVEYVTVWSLRQYQALAAKATRPAPSPPKWLVARGRLARTHGSAHPRRDDSGAAGLRSQD
jgi:hypothetical protein